MKRICLSFTILLAVSFLSTGCASKKQGAWLDSHFKILERAANSNIAPEKKLDILAKSYVDMMHQSLNFVNPKKGVAYAKTYSKQNDANIEKILKELGAWQEDMGPLELIGFGLKMTNKSYTKDMIDLFPRFRRKFKTYSTVFALSGKVRKGLLGLGGKKLGGLLGD